MSIVPYRKQRSVPRVHSTFDEFDRLFGNMFGNALTNLSSQGPSITDLAFRLDVSETDKAYIVKADLPGVEEKDIEVTVEEGVLTVSGEKQREIEEEGKTFHRTERAYGKFTRSLALPADADEDKIKAQTRNGVLEIEIEKAKEAKKKSKTIKVQAK